MDKEAFRNWFLKNGPVRKKTLAEKIAFCGKGFLPPQSLIHKAENNEWQANRAKWARWNGFIAGPKLVCILAYDETYIEILPKLWENFQMNINWKDSQMNIRNDECPDPSEFDSRINIWTALLHRWTQNEILGINRENQRYFGVQEDIRKDDKLKPEDSESNDIYIKMDELDRHFSELVKAPLPKLFSRKTEQPEAKDNAEANCTETKKSADTDCPKDDALEVAPDKWIRGIRVWEENGSIVLQHKG
jgi:hypothetical protein